MLVDRPIKDENCEIIQSSLLCIQVCSKLTEEETLEWVRKNSPAGTENNWGLSSEKEHMPIQCVNNSDKKHYMFVC